MQAVMNNWFSPGSSRLSERCLGGRRPHLVIVCLFLTGSMEIAASPGANPSTATAAGPATNAATKLNCSGGEIWPHDAADNLLTSTCDISINLRAKPYRTREIVANGIPNHCVDASY